MIKFKQFMLVGLIISTAILSRCTPKIPIAGDKPAEAKKEYVSIPFKKIISPAFADENNGKWVQFKAKFMMLQPAALNNTIPVDYRTNYVGICLSDVNDPMAATCHCSIPKDKSDIVFELKNGDTIEIWAHLIPLMSGHPYIEVEKISKVVVN